MDRVNRYQDRFWVLKENASAQHANGSTQFRYLLNDSVQRQINGSNVNPHFHNQRTNDYFWHTGVTDNKILWRNNPPKRNNSQWSSDKHSNISCSCISQNNRKCNRLFLRLRQRYHITPMGDGDLAELIICDTALSDSDIQKVEGYLAHKWGLQSSLPSSGHSYKSSPPQSTVWSQLSLSPLRLTQLPLP